MRLRADLAALVKDTGAIASEEARKASEQAATHHTRGKIVLKIAEEPKS